MAHGHARDLAKQRLWQRWVALWRTSGLGVREFCCRHDLAEASFYAWRRELLRRAQEQAIRPEREVAFVPVRVVADENDTPKPSGAAVGAVAGAALEVVLASGRIVRVGAGFDAATLRQLLGVLEDKPC